MSSYQERAISRRLIVDLGGEVRTWVLTGLGGAGKTQLAVNHAERAWARGEIDLLVWISAHSRDSIKTSYTGALQSVGDDSGDDAHDFLTWLAASPCRWLIVLDDLHDPRDIRGLWPPSNDRGHVLVTTRRRDSVLAGGGRGVIDIGPFSREQALAFLAARLGHTSPAGTGLARLADDLGDLPLALAQVAAHMIDRGLTPHEYHDRLMDAGVSMAEALPDSAGLPDDQTHRTHTTWRASCQLANDLEPAGLAGLLLDLATVLDGNGIPLGVFTASAALAYLTEHAADRQPVSSLTARDALYNLHRLSLITIRQPRNHVLVHRLVQRTAREDLPSDLRGSLVRVAADCLAQTWPAIETDRQLARSLRDNVGALLAHGERELWLPEPHPVLMRAGESLGDAGLMTAAARYFTQRHNAATRYLGPNHQTTLAMRSASAHWAAGASSIARAVDELQSVLDQQLFTLGADHADTLTTRSRLIQWHEDLPTSPEVSEATAQLIDDQTRVLGRDHPATLATVWQQIESNLAYGNNKTFSDTRMAMDSLIARSTRTLGPHHRRTFAARSRLACWLGESGQLTAAIDILEQLLLDEVPVLGANHRDTLATLGNLALWRGRSGDVIWALDTECALTDLHLSLDGPDHIDTLISRNNAAHWLGHNGRTTEALSALQGLMTDRLHFQGADHPHSLGNRYNIAHWVGEAGDPLRAASLLESVLADRRRLRLRHQFSALDTGREIAHWYGRAGNHDGAIKALNSLLYDQIQILGTYHHKTAVTISELVRITTESADLRAMPPASAWPHHITPS